jgi:hypothetical protein
LKKLRRNANEKIEMHEKQNPSGKQICDKVD